MAVHNYSNTASRATLDAPLNSSANSFTVSNFTGYPPTPFYILVDRDTSSSELMVVTTVAGSTLTVQRGQGGTASTSHSAGADVEHVIPAAVPQAVEQHIEATSGIHGVTGGLVGADNPGTLSNKLFDGAHRHRYSAGTPEAPDGGFVVEADTSIARDGFVANGQGASADRRGFLLRHDGAERIEGFYDGTVRVTPSPGATRPGIESTTSVRAASLDVTGEAAVGGNLNVTGNTVTSQLSAGNVTTSGTLNVGGEATLAGLTATRLQLPTAPTPTAAGQVRYRNGQIEVWDGAVWHGTRTLVFSQTTNLDPPPQSSGAFNLATMNIADPGWPYRLVAQGSVEVGLFAARWDLTVRVGSISGTVIAAARPDDRGDNFGTQLVTPLGMSGQLTGGTSVHLVMSYVSGGQVDLTGAFQTITVFVQPI